MPYQKMFKKDNYILSNRNIFDIIKERVKAKENGATVFVPHVCNNIDIFDAGFAAQVAIEYPVVKADYHMLGKNFLLSNLGYCQIIKVYEEPLHRHKLFFINMIAQNGVKNYSNNRPLNYFALGQSMYKLSQYIQMNTGFSEKSEKIEIHCPKFGSGLSGGNWNFISDLIHDIWGRFSVTVYNSPNKS
jgi:hypothetical protein